jgi:hypothetical protein
MILFAVLTMKNLIKQATTENFKAELAEGVFPKTLQNA